MPIEKGKLPRLLQDTPILMAIRDNRNQVASRTEKTIRREKERVMEEPEKEITIKVKGEETEDTELLGQLWMTTKHSPMRLGQR